MRQRIVPTAAELTGPSGTLGTAPNLAPENIAAVEGRLVDWGLERRVVTRVGSVLALPYPDGTFDAAWCANTSQYLSDADMETALAELRRVVRPGGLVAVKDSDSTLQLLPAGTPRTDPAYLLGFGRTRQRRGARDPAHGDVAGLAARAGLAQIRRHTTLIERDAPLPPPTKDQFRDFFAYYAGRDWKGSACPPTMKRSGQDYANRTLESVPDDPDFYFCEGSTLAFGRVPVE